MSAGMKEDKTLGELFHTTDGETYAIRVWRVVLYMDNRAKSLRFGGIMVNFCGHRRVARYLGWRLSWVPFSDADTARFAQ